MQGSFLRSKGWKLMSLISFHNRLSTAFIVLVVGIIIGCENEESRWKQSKSENTIQAYQDFLSDYPEGKHSNEAQLYFDFLNAQSENTIPLGDNQIEWQKWWQQNKQKYLE